jgi:hypothetical protein
VVLLTTPINECLGAVAERRAARGDTRPLDPTNTERRARAHESACRRLEAGGVTVWRLGREAAFAKVCSLLGVGP